MLLAKNSGHVEAVRDAARRSGIALDEVGSAFNREVDDLHERLGTYDLVFASARMALEAMAVGCAVIVVDGRGLAGLATAAMVDDWRVRNFGVSLLTQPLTSDAIAAEIARYNAADAATVSRRIREVGALPAYLDRVEALHREIAGAPPETSAPDDLRASGLFMAQWLRRLGEGTIPENFDTLVAANRFATEHRTTVEQNASLRRALDQSAGAAQAMEAELMALRQSNSSLRSWVAAWWERRFGRT